ncbi:MAG: hypothetical protein GXO21_03460 [Aquificae bacterium]|nr:hypothetical protein [Aquificota bacterium]
MKLQNFIFNRLGNSFSALFLYNEYSIQIWDKVKTEKFEILNFCLTEENIFSVFISFQSLKIEIQFTNLGIKVENFSFSPTIGGFKILLTEPDFIFKLSMISTKYIKIEKKSNEEIEVFIPQNDFFKGLTEFLYIVKF